MTTATSFVESHNDTEPVASIIDALRPEKASLDAAVATGQIGSNLVDTWDSYEVQLALAGAEPASFQIDLVARCLTVTGKYRIPVIENGSFIWRRILPGNFSESFELPGAVDGDKSEARFERGILTISLPKVLLLKPTSIQIHVVQ